MTPRIGFGFDAHQLRPSSRDTLGVRLGGVVVDESRTVVATSDGDVVAHALCDALLGAAALGDLGEMFPSSDPQWQDADSMELLRRVVDRVRSSGLQPTNVDVTVIAESVRVGPHRAAICDALAIALGLGAPSVSVKATTTDGLGYMGRDEGIAATAVVMVTPPGSEGPV